MDNIIELVSSLNELKKVKFESMKKHVDYIIDNNIKDSKYIEYTFDHLLDCCYDDFSINYFKKLCKYYSKIDKEGARFYRNELRNFI